MGASIAALSSRAPLIGVEAGEAETSAPRNASAQRKRGKEHLRVSSARFPRLPRLWRSLFPHRRSPVTRSKREAEIPRRGRRKPSEGALAGAAPANGGKEMGIHERVRETEPFISKLMRFFYSLPQTTLRFKVSKTDQTIWKKPKATRKKAIRRKKAIKAAKSVGRRNWEKGRFFFFRRVLCRRPERSGSPAFLTGDGLMAAAVPGALHGDGRPPDCRFLSLAAAYPGRPALFPRRAGRPLSPDPH